MPCFVPHVARAVACLSLISLFFLGDATAAGTDTSNLRNDVTLNAVRAHQAAFQAIADANGGNRQAGSPGGDKSTEYVVAQLESAGYDVTLQPFDFPYFEELSIPEFEQLAPTLTIYPHFDLSGFVTMTYSGSGDVTAPVQGVDIVIPPGGSSNTSTSGCEPSDFAGFTPGNIALIQRGTCTFELKTINAQNAGAVAVIIFNEGQPGRTSAFAGTLANPVATVPVITTAYAIGEDLYYASLGPGAIVRIFVNTISELRGAQNVIADLPGHYDRVVMAGAHLDSVATGPGINDNGSGAAALLEIALQMAQPQYKPRNTVRFAWWGAEEQALAGSQHYVSNLGIDAIKKLNAYLELEMLGSPNFVRFVYDGDGSDFPPAGPEGSGMIEQMFNDYFADQGLPTEPTPLDGRHSYASFYAAGIPVGGLFGGDTGIKTPEQAAIFGGSAGDQYDPCYHLACDTFDNVSLQALDEMSDAAAHAIQTLAMGSTSTPSNGSGRLTCEQMGYDFSLVVEPRGCRQSSGFWKSNPGAWPAAADTIEVGGVVYTKAEALEVMNAKAKGDKTYALFIETVAAMLNDLTCGPYPDMAAAIAAANDWLASHPPGSGVKSKDPEWNSGAPLFSTLSDFNGGAIMSGTWDLDGLASVDIVTLDGIYFDWTSTRSADAVIVKGGRNVHLYEYDPEAFGDLGLHAPINSKTGMPYALSYIEFCFDWDIDISVRKFNDLNDNGEWDPDEPEIGVEQFLNPDGTIGGTLGWPYTFSFPMDTGFLEVFWTPETHQHSFAGVYTIVEQEFRLWDPTALIINGVPQAVDTRVDIPYAGDADESVEVIFGNVGYAEILGRKFEDLNGNGSHDDGEPGVAGVEVTLTGTDIFGNGVGVAMVTGPGGEFAFLNLVPGIYTVTETTWPPGGWMPSTLTSSGPHVLDSGDSLDLGGVFGNLLPGSIHGYKFVDVNGNGIEDDGEPGLAGVTIELTGDVNGDGVIDLVSATTSSPEGEYHFTGLWPGDYSVAETVPPNWIAVTPTSTDVTVVSGVERVARAGQAMLTPVQIGAGYEEVIDESLVFGNLEPGSIHGYKFNDFDADGVEDPGETRIPGVTIVLIGDVDGDGDLDELQTTTASPGGEYGFTGLWPGTYEVSEVVPDGWIPTTPTTTNVTVNSGEELVAQAGQARLPPDSTKVEVVVGSDLTFGNFELGSIHGYKFEDLNGNGVNDGEPRVPGVVIELHINGTVIDTTTTDAAGEYAFLDLSPNEYYVTEVIPPGWVQSTPNPPPMQIVSGQEYVAEPGLASLPPDSSKYETVEPLLAFGNYQKGSIHGFKFEDLNGDGIQDPGEPRLAEWQFELIDADGNVIAVQPTDENGEFWFFELRPGDYLVQERVPDGWIASTENPVSLTIVSGEEAVAVDGQANLPPDSTKFEIVDARLAFGNWRYAYKRGMKFEDLNGDGVRDAGEPGVPGVEICADGVCDLTDANGNYELQLAPGSYLVCEQDVSALGWVQSYPANDVCAGVAGAAAGGWGIALVSGEEDNDNDFGNWRFATVSGRKWEDLNGNAIPDAGEPGVPGVEICADGSCDITDAAGNYELTLSPGLYTVQETCPDGWFQSFPPPVNGCGSGVHNVELASGQVSADLDFGNFANRAPEIITSATPSVPENQSFVIDIETTDDNDSEGAGLTYSLTGGADLGFFSLNAVTGVLEFNSAPDFENPLDAGGNNVYDVQVTVTDSGPGGSLTDVQDLAVTVTDVNEPPTAPDLFYSATGNVTIDVPAASGLLIGASDPDGDLIAVDGVSNVSPGAVVASNPDGSFSYTPPPGFTGTDSFNYTLIDDGVPAETSVAATVEVTVNDMIWFIDNTAGAGVGTLASPFNTLADFEASLLPAIDDCIFIDENSGGDYIGPITLLNGQILIGKGVSDSIPIACGISMAPGSATLPTTGGARPIITSLADGVLLASGNTVRGLNIGDIGNSGFKGTAVGTLTINEVEIGDDTPSGGGIEVATSGTLSVVFDSLSANSSSDEGIRLNGVSGSFAVTTTDGTISTTGVPAIDIDGNASVNINTLTFASVSAVGAFGIVLMDTTGSFTVTGAGGDCPANAANCSGGSITGSIYIQDAQNVSLNAMQIDGSAWHGVALDNVDGFLLDNSRVTNNGSAVGEQGIRARELTGPVQVTNSLFDGNFEDHIEVVNTSNPISSVVTVTGNLFDANDPVQGNNGISYASRNGANPKNVAFDIANNTFQNIRATAVQIDAEADTTHTISVGGAGAGNTFDNNNTALNLTNNFTGNVTAVIDNNVMTNHGSSGAGQVINLFSATSSAAGSSFDATVSNNTIGTSSVSDSGTPNGNALRILSQGTTTFNALVEGNAVHGVTNGGIDARARDGVATLNLTLRNNNLNFEDSIGVNIAGTANAAGETVTVCADIGGPALENTISNVELTPLFVLSGVAVQQAASAGGVSTFTLPNYVAAPADAFIDSQNTITTPGAVAAVNVFASGTFTGGASCTLP